ncbi:hypothetical protein I302_101041 [Kwoniella bestiolae CBS 10118]|uniref:RNase III domain-containing protein n=1 Tax=Kwoniella bestiolae CBS 10118 TaxID=1296100 RepID=A0AAJ8M517_9TREE
MTKPDISDDTSHNPHRATFDKSLTSLWPLSLPPIPDDTLSRCATTHSSIPLENTESKYRYERLAFVGEGILFSFVTSLLQDIFPDIDRESASILRTKLISPPILSSISLHYFLPSRVIISRHILEPTRKSIKATSEMFQAYLGGLFYAYELRYIDTIILDEDEGKINPALRERNINRTGDQENVVCTEEEGRQSKKRKISNDSEKILDEVEMQYHHTSAQAQAYTKIQPLLLGILSELSKRTYDPDENEHRKLLEMSENSKGELHILLGKNKLPMPLYTQDKVLPEPVQTQGQEGTFDSNGGGRTSKVSNASGGRNEKGLKWKVGCIIVLPDDEIFIREEGIAQNSKDAGNIAAYLALKKLREMMLDRGKRWKGKEGEISEKD